MKRENKYNYIILTSLVILAIITIIPNPTLSAISIMFMLPFIIK